MFNYVDISSVANELHRKRIVGPYEIKLKTEDFNDLLYNLQHQYSDKFVNHSGVLAVRTTFGNVLIREVY